MPTAFISDIHGNAAALKAVLADIDARGIDRIVCLGDIVGYGPDPLECVDLVRERCAWALLGNHDFGVLYEPTSFNAAAEAAAFWSRDRFDEEPEESKRRSRYEFLHHLRVRVVETPPGFDAPILAVHASPRRPINEYILREDPLDAPDKMRSIFDRVERLCFVGHTHVPGVFTDEPDFYPPAELAGGAFTLQPDEKAIVNVGSVGQPRDGDPRAAYAVLGDGRVEFFRVAYDIDQTASRIRAAPQLHPWLADRLYEGQ